MWSSDATLLKSLLDAGETIIAVHNLGFGRLFVHDCEYVFDVVGYLHYVEFQLAEFLFLIPPRPLVLEPKPLEWTEVDDENGECLESKDGLFWDFWCWSNGDWGIELDGAIVAENTSKGNFDTAKAAIHEWRVNHLKSMLP